MNVRALAANCLFQVVDKGQSLNDALPQAQQQLASSKDKALLQHICYGVLRWLPKLDYVTNELVSKPLKGKQRLFQFLLYVGIYQLAEMRIPAHAAVAETVKATKQLKAPGLKGMINGVLRNFQRREQALWQAEQASPVLQYAHPNWFIKRVQAAYPEQWQQILSNNQQQAPLWLRVNEQVQPRNSYSDQLNELNIKHTVSETASQAILLDTPIDVAKLPDFELGSCSVQDAAAQHAALLLDAQPHHNVLDACAAPGGKTCHILELTHDIKMTAIDSDESRLSRVLENLQRLKLTANTICGDASQPQQWFNGELYDRILLDAPCSATGVIRRHPDIKWLRRNNDIAELAALQQKILLALWPTLKPGGILLYATCSVLPEENQQQIEQFLASQTDAELLPIAYQHDQRIGWQILPGDNNMDGFYYAKLHKKINETK
ncbi:16S rRNA (cytosine(967)-C(5))-methyltransferase RsmB [Flocculibacter collagenilyticus]|uniref:16S rRNA (cytosine(967)-C(5))-methyltransferase RsmB n=1 Tax=Flocculibacter collagenilyticus TaxID=2744479 RepID=UPI0018F27A8F|nr:16S rRNA (cytosine(967)-C(5))-methyltransferase RsmB [Flocculibacter collagenilyticus]